MGNSLLNHDSDAVPAARASAGVPEAFLAYFDDAAVFPPGLAPLDVAVSEHVGRRRTPLTAAVGPLVLPLKDVPEAKKLAMGEDLSSGPVTVSVVTPAGQLQAALTATEEARPELEIVAIELKTSPDKADWTRELEQAAGLDGPQLFVELTTAQLRDGALELLAGTGLRLKYRTGGIEARLFPTTAELARVLVATAEKNIPFKLTAGLHRAVRYTDRQTGFTHHGFLNIAVAAALAQQHAGTPELEAVLSETDHAELVAQYHRLDPSWRRSFNSFGTCSAAEPAQSLAGLGLFPAAFVSALTESDYR